MADCLDKGNTPKPCIVTQKEDCSSLESNFAQMWVSARLVHQPHVQSCNPHLHRGKVWSPFSLRVVVEEHNYQAAQLDNKMPTSAEHVVMFMMQSTKSADLIGQQQVSAMPTTRWLQHDQTLPLYEGCV